MENEIWNPIPGYPPYYVSNLGRVKNSRTNKIRKPVLNDCNGRYRVQLYIKETDSRKTFYVYHLVMLAFVGPMPFDKREVNHIDGDKENNKLENLEYVTSKENKIHAKKMGRIPLGSKRPNSKLNESQINRIRKIYIPYKYSWRRIAEEYGVSTGTIKDIFDGKSWSHV